MSLKTPDQRFAALAEQAPPPQKPVGCYRPVARVGNTLYVSGHGPKLPSGDMITGRIGSCPEFDLAYGKNAARQVALGVLSTLKDFCGSLGNLRLVKTLGVVLSTDDFGLQPLVINGFSEVMAEVFGEERGIGARSALGTNALPGETMEQGSPQISVEVEAIFEIEA